MKKRFFIVVTIMLIIFFCIATYASTKIRTKNTRTQEETVEAFPFHIGDDHSPSMKDYPPQETVEPCPLK